MRQINRIPDRLREDHRQTAVAHEGAKIMLNVYDMADEAGMTDGELLNLLHEQITRTVSKILAERIKGEKQ